MKKILKTGFITLIAIGMLCLSAQAFTPAKDAYVKTAGFREVETNSCCTILTWKGEIIDNGAPPRNHYSLRFSLLDIDGYEIAWDLANYTNTSNLTNRTVVKKHLGAQIHSIKVEVKKY
jgi:hypothetical protein